MTKYLLAIVLFMGLSACTHPNEQSSPSFDASVQTAPEQPFFADSTFNRIQTSKGQLVYVPVYSHIYQQNRRKTFNLTATLSIRNTDPNRTIGVRSVNYFDSQGNLVQSYIDEPITIPPLASISYVIEEEDLRGGVGANFLVRWSASKDVFPPVIEAVMISTSMQQGISFISNGRIIEER
ncbi:MAG: DUF3124 domain-containing protein [Bacteroidota bacterium]